MKLRYITALLISIIAIGIGSFQVSANNLEIPFGVNLITPESQDEGIDNYVSITTDKDSIEEKLEFSLVNNGDSDKEIIIEVVDGYTAPSGVVQYSVKGPENSEITDEDYKMSNYVTIEGNEDDNNIIKLKKGETKVVTLKLNVEKLDGTILGGILFKEKEEETNGSEGNFSIESEVNMVIGVQVNFGTEKLVELEVGKPFVEVMPTLHVIRLPVELNTPAPKKVNFDYNIEKDGEVLFSNVSEIDFAPMAKANVRFPWENETIEDREEYTLKGTMSYNDLDGQVKEIEVSQDFVYKKDSAAKNIINRIVSPIEEGGTGLIWLLGLLVLIPLLVIIVIKRKQYSYYSNDNNAPDIVNNDDELYSKMTKNKSAKDKNKYRHVYKKVKDNYKHIKTKELK